MNKILLVLSMVATAFQASASDGSDLGLVPRPWKLKVAGTGFEVKADTRIELSPDNAETRALAARLQDALRFDPQLAVGGTAGEGRILLALDPALKSLGEEGYHLDIDAQGISIRAFAPAGAFYGIQTLRQLLPAALLSEQKSVEKRLLPGLKIEDRPAFAWRGTMLDVGRHFLSKQGVMLGLDRMALHKMNRFHWHLTEDQGWRIEIKKYPKLTGVGAWRDEENGTHYGGFYTQEEIKEVVAYAAERYITVIPEIEMPGHSSAALSSYPELSCTGGPFKVPNTWGVFDDVLCPGKDSTFKFIEDVLDEVLPLFPSPYVHLGGDECPKARWKAHDLCQARMKQEGLADEKALQAWFLGRVSAMVKARGKRLIGWDEICEGGAPKGSIVQWWIHPEYVVEATKKGHDIITSNYVDTYLDQGYSSVSVKHLYEFSPYPKGLPAENRKRVLGAESPLWTEGVASQERVDYQTYPRLCALAENLWLKPELKNFDDFESRLERHKVRLDALGVRYRDLGTRVGEWDPGYLHKHPGAKIVDLSAQIQTPGAYALTFEYLKGASSLEIRLMTLKSGGDVLAQVTTTAFAGYWIPEPTLNFVVSDQDLKLGLRLTCVAKAEKGWDSYGRIFLSKR